MKQGDLRITKSITRIFSLLLALCLLASVQAFASGEAGAEAVLTVPAGETVILEATTEYDRVIIEEGGVLAAPEGKSITLTVNGMEMGQVLTTTGRESHFAPEEYVGNVVVTVTERTNPLVTGINSVVTLTGDDIGGTWVGDIVVKAK